MENISYLELFDNLILFRLFVTVCFANTHYPLQMTFTSEISTYYGSVIVLHSITLGTTSFELFPGGTLSFSDASFATAISSLLIMALE